MPDRETIIRAVRDELLADHGDQDLREVILAEIEAALAEADVRFGDATRQRLNVAAARAVGTISVTYADRATAAITGATP